MTQVARLSLPNEVRLLLAWQHQRLRMTGSALANQTSYLACSTPASPVRIHLSLEISQVITPCFDFPALCGRRAAHLEQEAEHILPKSLNFLGAVSSSSQSDTNDSESDSTEDSSADTASTMSFLGSSDSDNPDLVWAAIGLSTFAALVHPRPRMRLNTPSTDASSHYTYQSYRQSISSGCRTPVSDSDYSSPSPLFLEYLLILPLQIHLST